MTTLSRTAPSVLVDEVQRTQASELVTQLDRDSVRLTVECGPDAAVVPEELGRILARILNVMADGGTVTVGSLPAELTTTAAAEQMGISRPTLMKLIRNGGIKAHKVGTHHRLKLRDVLAYKKQRLEDQRRAFDELREIEERYGI